MRRIVRSIIFVFLVSGSLLAADNGTIPGNARVYIAAMNGFEANLRAAIIRKQVPIQLVEKREQADYEITGASASDKDTPHRAALRWDLHSNEEVTMKVTELKTGSVACDLQVDRLSAFFGARSTAEAAAKHLKTHIR